MTECECELAGYCNRHGVKKNSTWHQLCKRDPVYFRAWENGTGPGQRTSIAALNPTAQYNHWGPLHFYAVKHADNWDIKKAKAFYRKWQKDIPNTKTCACKSNWKKLALKPDFSSAKAFFEWAVHAHNVVNAKLKKAEISLPDAYAIWWK